MKFTKTTRLALAIGAIAFSNASMAATDTSTLTVNATVENNCAIGNGTLGFGTRTLAVDKAAGTAGTIAAIDADTVATISIICTNGASANITADVGANAGDGTVRKMKDATSGNVLSYELYTNSSRSTVLNADNSIAYTGTGAATTATSIFGRIAGADLQAATKGTYTDSVGLTITYTP